MRVVSITTHGKEPFRIEFQGSNFIPLFLDRFKQLVPDGDRQYNYASRFWLVDVKHFRTVFEHAWAHFDRIDEFDNEKVYQYFTHSNSLEVSA